MEYFDQTEPKNSLNNVPKSLITFEQLKQMINNSDYHNRAKHCEELKPHIEEFFYRIRDEKPDYIILLDKGARPFGMPFRKFLAHLHSTGFIQKVPKILFWNSDSFMTRDHKNKDKFVSELTNHLLSEAETLERNEQPKNAREKLVQLLASIVSGAETKSNKPPKLFFVDETLSSGNFASVLQTLFEQHSINGQYFAFSHCKDTNLFELFSNKLNYNYCTVFPVSVEFALFTKYVASLYIKDKVYYNSTQPTETIPRFRGTTTDDIETEKYEFAFRVRKEAEELLMQTLMNTSIA